jgi:hypothetical protein
MYYHVLKMATRYDIRPDLNGWTVFDTETSTPIVVNGILQVGLSLDDADDLADLLDRLAWEQLVSTSH